MEVFLVVDKVQVERRKPEPIQRNIYTDYSKAIERLSWDKGKRVVKATLFFEEEG